MTDHLEPESRTEFGGLLEVPAVPQQLISQSVVDVLIAGLRLAEMNLDYVEVHGHYRHLHKNFMHSTSKNNPVTPQPFNAFVPRFSSLDLTAYIDGIEFEARQTAAEFNEIMKVIGGLPVKIELSRPEDTIDGSITGLKDYKDGGWIYGFTGPKHPNGINLRGDTNMLQAWHSAARLQLPEELDAQEL